MYFVFIIKTRYKSVSRDNGKITREEICDYLASRRNVEKRLINTEVSIQSRKKNMMDFDYYEEYLKSIWNKILLLQCYEKQKRKTDSNFKFFQAAKLLMRF